MVLMAGAGPDESMSVTSEAYSPQDTVHSPQYVPYDSPVSYPASETELGCMYGHPVQTGIVKNTYLNVSFDPSKLFPSHALTPLRVCVCSCACVFFSVQDDSPSPVLERAFHAAAAAAAAVPQLLPPPVMVSGPSPFPLTRSYTLAGAVDDPQPYRPHHHLHTQTPPHESPRPPSASPGACDYTDSAFVSVSSAGVAAIPHAAPIIGKKLKATAGQQQQHHHQQQQQQHSTPPPHTSAAGSALFTRFSSKQPFRTVVPPSSHSAPSSLGEHKSDADAVVVVSGSGNGGLDTFVEDGKRQVLQQQQQPAKKKPTMACLFCRERKICCGPPTPDSADPRCK